MLYISVFFFHQYKDICISIFNYIHLHSINGERVSVVDVVDYPNAIGNPVKRNIVGVCHEPSTTNLNE